MSAVMLEGVPDFTIRDGLVFITANREKDGLPKTVCCTVKVFRAGIKRANRMLDDYMEEQPGGGGRVLPIRRSKADG